MEQNSTARDAGVADIDFMVTENGDALRVPGGSTLKIATDVEQTIGATGPTNWWRIGLLALIAVALVLLALQLLGGNLGTDVIPGTPVAAPLV